MKQTYYLIDFPEIQDYQIREGYNEHSYICADINGAAFVEKEWADAVDRNEIPIDENEME